MLNTQVVYIRFYKMKNMLKELKQGDISLDINLQRCCGLERFESMLLNTVIFRNAMAIGL